MKLKNQSVMLDQLDINFLDNNPNFSNRCDGMRKCIQIARRVYEKATEKEKVKFLIQEV